MALVLLAGGTALGADATVLPLSKVVPEYMPGDLETAITPTPQRAELADAVFRAGKVLVVQPDKYDAPPTLLAELRARLGEEAVQASTAGTFSPAQADTVIFVGKHRGLGAWDRLVKSENLQPLLDQVADKGPDGYVLLSAPGKLEGKHVVLLAGNSLAADFWALATLRQMTFTKDKADYIRQGRVADFPRFAYRGNKRPQRWEWRYKANYAWFFSQRDFPDRVARADYFRGRSAWVHHGEPLRATDQEMDDLINGPTDPRTKRPVAGARDAYQQGCREYVLKFDDTGWKLSDASERQFAGSDRMETYFKALHHFLAGMHRRIKALDAQNRVFFMPQPYAYNAYDQAPFVEGLLRHGPLPPDMGLSVCGLEVISWYIPTACMRDFRELYGLQGKAQIYDNFGRGGEYFAYTGRDPDLYREVECIFPERGTPVTRITVYDYLWNPEAYDPDRALRLAVRELSGGDPQLYQAMWDYVSYYNQHRNFTPCPAPEEAAKKLPQINRQMKRRFDALAPLLDRSALAVETKLKFEFWGPEEPKPTYEWGEYARLRRRLEFEPYERTYNYRQAEVMPTTEQIAVDGRLDEAAWKAARWAPDFVGPAWGRKTAPTDLAEFRLSDDQRARMKMLYSTSHLHVGIEFNYREKPVLPGWAQKMWADKKPGQQADVAWRVPCIELFFDPTARQEHYYSLVGNMAHLWFSTHLRAFEARQSGTWWKPDWKFQFTLGERSGVFEASIPLAALGQEPPRPGTVWGFQAFRSKIGPMAVFSGVYDLVGGEHATREFGRIVFR